MLAKLNTRDVTKDIDSTLKRLRRYVLATTKGFLRSRAALSGYDREYLGRASRRMK
jgi:hypothetical protein